MKKKLRLAASIAVLALTAGLFAYYLSTHPEVLDQLTQTSLIDLFAIAALYLGVVLSLTIVNTLSVRMCGKVIGKKESFALTSSSSIANFFGPLQSGVGIRAVYFKTKLGIPIKQYVLVSLYYYSFYAFFSGLFLLFGNEEFRLPLLALTILGASLTAIYIYKKSKSTPANQSHISIDLLLKLAATVLLQLSLIAAIYFIQLTSIDSSITLAQTISYTGAANFSLFVAITPGAIGIREAFLLFSQRLHGISSATVVAANVIDRSVYVIFLGLLFFGLAAFHIKVQINGRLKDKADKKL